MSKDHYQILKKLEKRNAEKIKELNDEIKSLQKYKQRISIIPEG